MNTAAYLLIVALVLSAGIAAALTYGARVFLRYRGEMLFTCPETGKLVAVKVAASKAALSSLTGRPDIHLNECSRWPERQDCVGVRARCDEDDVGEVGHPGDAEFEVESPSRDQERAEVDKENDRVVLPAGHVAERFRRVTPAAAKRPRGRMRSTMIRIVNATTSWYAGLQ